MPRKKTKPKHKTPGYSSWVGMKQRCLNPKCRNYGSYGGRGIKVHEPWIGSFEAFISYIGKKPGEGYSIDRYPNRDGNYEPGNVRWATAQQQSDNSSRVLVVRMLRRFDSDGQPLPSLEELGMVTELQAAVILGTSLSTVYRLFKDGRLQRHTYGGNLFTYSLNEVEPLREERLKREQERWRKLGRVLVSQPEVERLKRVREKVAR